MRIKRIEITAFGKFKDFSMDFADGFNLIYGKNEDGKSTIMAFIALMLYGSAGTSGRTDISKNIRKKYMPWSGEAMSGDMEIEYGGKDYRIHKEFKATAKSDKISVTDIQTGEKLSLPPDTEIGKYFLNLDYQGFEKSVFGFTSDPTAGEENADISARLSNLSESGDENISPMAAISRLEKAKELLISKRGNKGRLVELTNQAESLKERIAVLKAKEESRKTLEGQYEAVEGEIKSLEIQLQKAQKWAELKEQRQRAIQLRRVGELIGEKEQKENELSNIIRVTSEDLESFAGLVSQRAAAEDKLRLAQERQKEKEKKRRSLFKNALPLGIAIILIGIIGGILNPWLFALEGIGVAVLVYMLITGKKDKSNTVAEAEENLKQASAEMDLFLKEKSCKNREQLEDKYKQGIALEAEIKILGQNIDSFNRMYQISEKDKNKLLNLAQDIEKALPDEAEAIDGAEIQRQLSLKNSRLLEIKGQMGERADIGSLERELTQLTKKKEEMTAYYNALSLASEVMTESADEMSRSFAPRLRERASQLLNRLTNGRYSALSVSKAYEIEVKTGDTGAYRSWQYLSRGTCAQSYLALRLAVCELLEEDGGKIPIILDDALSDYDAVREKETADFLEEYAEGGRQVLFFTCHNWQGDANARPLI